MPTGTIQQVATVGGISAQSTVTRTASSQIGHESDPVLPVAKVGTLSTRTNDTDGTLTLEADHGITVGQLVDIFWIDVDGVSHCAYGATAGVIDVLNVPFTGASGDVLPAEGYAITASVPVTIDTDFDGDLLEMIIALATYLGHVTFCDVGDAVLAAVTLVPGEGWSWVSDQGIANPLTGNAVAYVLASNGSSAYVNTVKIGALYNGQS
ncbi:MAG: hypothetical protein JW741_25435 [Sedimentisphaerales bacterium]|nr:hypothetical protein [Sedimentisphaerales bacterium]